MTKQLERAYRNNRRRSWLLIIAVVALAAVMVPIASGASEKTYTLLFPSSGATNPAAKPTASSPTTTNQTLCAGTAYSVTVTLKNTARTVSLGSAEIMFPSSVTLSGTPTIVSDSIGYALPAAARATMSTLSANTVSLRELSLPKGKQVKLTVSLTASAIAVSAAGSIAFDARVKQSNDFNDTGGSANTFEKAVMPTITVETCVATIKGQIWNDSNESGAPKDDFESLQRDGFSVALYQKGASSYTTPVAGVTLEYDANGYTFSNVPTGKDYVVCETAPLNTTWKQTTGEDLSSLSLRSPCSALLPKGWAFNLTENVTLKDFGNANTVEIDCGIEASLRPPPVVTAQTRYTVRVSGDTCKNGVFVLEAYAPDATQRVANFHPVVGGTTTKIDLIEKMEWSFDGEAQPDPAGRSLKYDDNPDAAPGLLPMLYCLKDPRANASGVVPDPWSLVTTDGVLPPDATSCLITSTEKAAVSVTDPRQFRREDWIFSSVDGYRLGP